MSITQRKDDLSYHHKQIGTALLCIMATVLCFILFAAIGKNNQVIWPVIIILSAVSFLFHSLNIQVNNSVVDWSFGPGFWRKSLKVDNIISVRPVNTKWYYGLGIRYIGSGWLYIVSGSMAVELKLKNGSTVYLGTNDAENLIKAIKSQSSIINT